MKLHHSITTDRVLALAESQLLDLENPGICKACGSEQDGCEPDARNYICESCEQPQVFGASELLMEMI